MSGDVQVRLLDGRTVAVPEPGWCTSTHADGEALEDLFHEGTECGLTVETGRGPVEVLTVSIVQYPFRPDVSRRLPVGSVLLGGEFFELGPCELRALATGLAVHADRLRDVAMELTRLRSGGAR